VKDNQNNTHATRRTELDEQFRALPAIGTAAYWGSIEDADARHTLGLEVLARCFRERTTAGAADDAERIFTAIWQRVQSSVQRWARSIASRARSGMTTQLSEDLEQECFLKLWEELEGDGPTFLMENFAFAFGRLRQHVAHDVMERAGEWRRPGVATPTRVPSDQTGSLQAEPAGEDETPLIERIVDDRAQDPFDRVDLSDLLALVMSLPEDQRTIILDRYWRDQAQEETAARLGISDRMVRYRLKTILRELGVRYRGSEEDTHA
jgi:RNA polymerase sigma factor (sigma-70 family)